MKHRNVHSASGYPSAKTRVAWPGRAWRGKAWQGKGCSQRIGGWQQPPFQCVEHHGGTDRIGHV